MIVVPKESYQNACLTLRIPTLNERRESVCKSVFNMKDPYHRLHHMILVKKNLGNRSYPKYELPKCKTERDTRSVLYHGTYSTANQN